MTPVSVTPRWSSWSAEDLAAVSCEAPFQVLQLDMVDGRGDDPLLVCAGAWEPITLVDPSGDVPAQKLTEVSHTPRGQMIASGPGGPRLVAWHEAGAGQVQDLDDPGTQLTIGGWYGIPRLVAGIGGVTVVVTTGSEFRFWQQKTCVLDAGTGRVLAGLEPSRGERLGIPSVAIIRTAAGEPLLVGGERGGQIRVWDLPTARLRHVYQCPVNYGDGKGPGAWGGPPGRRNRKLLAAWRAIPLVGGGPAGDITVVVAAWQEGLFCWRLETGELLHGSRIGPLDIPGPARRDLVVGRVGGRWVIARLSAASPVAYEAGTGAPVPLHIDERAPSASAAALRAAAFGIVYAVSGRRYIRCHTLQEAPVSPGETGVESVAAGRWNGRLAVVSRDIDEELWIRDLATGQLIERRHRGEHHGAGRRLGFLAGRFVGYSGSGPPVDLLTGEHAGPFLQVPSGYLAHTWWGTVGGRQFAAGVLYEFRWRRSSAARYRIAVWDGATGRLRSLREAHGSDLTLAIGTMGGQPALAVAYGQLGVLVESEATYVPGTVSMPSLSLWTAAYGRSEPWNIRGPNAVVMLDDRYLAFGGDDGIVRVLRFVRSSKRAGGLLRSAAKFDVGTPVRALAYAGEGRLVIGCGAGVQLADIRGLPRSKVTDKRP